MGGRLIYLMGPSGSGKDSLIGAAQELLRSQNCEVVRRVITRSAESVGEDAIGVSREEFAHLKAQGGFALAWSANGLEYGIPIQIDEWLMSGRDVLVNGSRGYLEEALLRYPALMPVLITVSDKVLLKRLVRRGRESLAEIEARLLRNALFVDRGTIDGVQIMTLDNSGDLDITVASLMELLAVNGVLGQI
jgi:ribose 1,5-bisphosphokinase